MAKVKVNDILGIITNVDENDLSLEAARYSENFKFEHNWAIPDFPNLELDSSTPVLPNGYEYEDGITCILSSDNLSYSDTSFQKEIIFLSAKKTVIPPVGEAIDQTIYIHRKFYVKVDDLWQDLAETQPHITNEIIITSHIEDIFFAVEEGRLKIYLPHTAFWLGYIDRKVYLPSVVTVNELYFDKLIEKFDFDISNTYANWQGDPALGLIPSFEGRLTSGYRTGVEITASVTNDTTGITGEKYLMEEIYRKEFLRDGNYSADLVGYRLINTVTKLPLVFPVDIPNGVQGMEAIIKRTTEVSVYTSLDINDLPIDPEYIWPAAYMSSSGKTFFAPKIFGNYLVRVDGAEEWHDQKPALSVPLIYLGRQYFESTDIIDEKEYYYFVNENVNNDNLGLDGAIWQVITTATLDNRSEIIIDYAEGDGDSLNPWGIKVEYLVPSDINKRITKISSYIRVDAQSDFEMFYESSLLNNKKLLGTSIATDGTLTGIFLSAKIGITIDPREKNYDVVQGIKSRTLEAGYAIASAYDNPAYIQYNAIGGGKIMTDIFYYEAELELNDVLGTQALAGSNGKLFIISDVDTKVLNIEGTTGQPIFMMIDTLEFGVKNRRDAIEVQGGILLNTNEGIYLTNGYEKEWISETINDICIDNYITSRIFYNKYKHEVYYFPDINLGEFFLFNFRRRKWEGRKVQGLVSIKSLLQSVNGEVSFLSDYTSEETWTETIEHRIPIVYEDGGSGTAGDPYHVSTTADFMAMEGSNSHYILINDIDLTGVSSYDASKGVAIYLFNGSLNGNGYTISNFNPGIGLWSGGSGLFHTVSNSVAKIAAIPVFRNIHIDSFDIEIGTALNITSAGGGMLLNNLIGTASTSYIAIDNIKVTNSTFTFDDGNKKKCYYGMVLGNSGTGSYSYGNLRYCVADDTNTIIAFQLGGIGADQNYVGGLVGKIPTIITAGKIEKSMSGVSIIVTATGALTILAGGVAGIGTVENCSYIGVLSNLSSTDNISSMGAGQAEEYNYSVPSFSGGTTKYGFTSVTFGTNGYSTSFVNSDQTYDLVQEGDINEETTANMKLEATYTGAGWNFATIWIIEPTINDGYPSIQYINDYEWGIDPYTIEVEVITYTKDITIQGFFAPSEIDGTLSASITSPLSNIASPDIEKRINYCDINFIGNAVITLYDEFEEIQSWTLEANIRNTERLYVMLVNSRPAEKFKYKLTTTDKDFIFYSIHIDFNVEEKDGGFGALPENQIAT